LATPWYLTHDLLIRRLRDRGHDVTLVRNVTDVDDSILDYAREHELDYADLAAKEVKRFASEMAQLNIDAPDREPMGNAEYRDNRRSYSGVVKSGLYVHRRW
jgi:cysteinyl-tRNA synthetase